MWNCRWIIKINKFRKESSIEQRILDKSDILDVVKHMHNLIDGKGEVDEIPSEGYLLNGFLFGFTNKFYETYTFR